MKGDGVRVDSGVLVSILVLTAIILSFFCLPFFFMLPKSPPNEEDWPSWAPDSQRLVYECYLDGPTHHDSWIDLEGPYKSFYTEEAADLCIGDISEHKQVRLTRDPEGDWHPAWSPDGAQIAYLRDDGIYLITPEGQNRHQIASIDYGRSQLWRLTWSPDGNSLLFSACLDQHNHDVYIVDVDTGQITNLTPNSHMHDFDPMWTLDGSKIIFLSTDSADAYVCSPARDALPKMNVMNADGSDKQIVYDPEYYYPYGQISISSGGRIAFVTNMTSRTNDEYYDRLAEPGDLYVMDVVNGTLVKVFDVVDDWGSILLPTWSPDERYVAYRNNGSLRIISLVTDEVIEPQAGPSINSRFVWSPDSQKVAVTVSIWEDFAIDSEEHIHIFDVQNRTYERLLPEEVAP